MGVVVPGGLAAPLELAALSQQTPAIGGPGLCHNHHVLAVPPPTVSTGRGWVLGGTYVSCLSGPEWAAYASCTPAETGGHRGLWQDLMSVPGSMASDRSSLTTLFKHVNLSSANIPSTPSIFYVFPKNVSLSNILYLLSIYFIFIFYSTVKLYEYWDFHQLSPLM